jgi:hypothetical protein
VRKKKKKKKNKNKTKQNKTKQNKNDKESTEQKQQIDEIVDFLDGVLFLYSCFFMMRKEKKEKNKLDRKNKIKIDEE